MDIITQKEKIKRFVSDKVMSEAVYHTLLRAFLKKKDREDVHSLAAARIAIDLLDEGWRELEKLKSESGGEKKELEQVGL